MFLAVAHLTPILGRAAALLLVVVVVAAAAEMLTLPSLIWN